VATLPCEIGTFLTNSVQWHVIAPHYVNVISYSRVGPAYEYIVLITKEFVNMYWIYRRCFAY